MGPPVSTASCQLVAIDGRLSGQLKQLRRPPGRLDLAALALSGIGREMTLVTPPEPIDTP